MSNPLVTFTQALWQGGELVLSSNEVATSIDLAEAVQLLRTIEPEYRKTLPAGVPPLSIPAAEWALASFYRASQFLVFRELPEELLRTELLRACPEEESAAVCYSVDLSFRFLPELLRLTRAVNSQDPLLEILRAWAVDWPLSSVGIAAIAPTAIEAVLANPALRTIYVYRILSTSDTSRINQTEVKEAVRTALGGFRELSPMIYDLVNGAEETTGTPDSLAAEQ